jgi:hypothetical protein
MTKIEELTIKAIEIANDQSISQDRKELAIKCLIQGEIDDVLKLTHNIRETSLPHEIADRLHQLEITHGIYTMKKYLMK